MNWKPFLFRSVSSPHTGTVRKWGPESLYSWDSPLSSILLALTSAILYHHWRAPTFPSWRAMVSFEHRRRIRIETNNKALAIIPFVGYFCWSCLLHYCSFLLNPHLYIKCRKVRLFFLISDENQQILVRAPIRFLKDRFHFLLGSYEKVLLT